TRWPRDWSSDVCSSDLFSRARALALTMLAVSACGGGETTGPAPQSSQIAFASNRDGNNEIYVMNPDGSAQTRLTSNSAGAATPEDRKSVVEGKRDDHRS